MSTLHRRFVRAESGMEAVEGMIVLTLMIFILVMFLSFGFLFYQQWVVSGVANDTATRIAQSYAYSDADPVTGYISRTMKLSVSPFRHMGSSLADKNADRGEKYALWSLDMSSLATLVTEPDIEVTTVHDSFAQSHVEVKITATYLIPFGGALEYFGMDGKVTYHGVGYAVTSDISNYMRSVDTLSKLAGTDFGLSGVGTVNDILSAVQKIAELFT